MTPGQTRMPVHQQHPPCKSCSVEKAPNSQHTLFCILIKHTCWAKQTFLDWIILPVLTKTGKFCAVSPGTQLSSRAQSTPTLQLAPAWCSALMGTADHRGTQGEQQKAHPTASTANNPRGNSILISELGEQSHGDVEELGLPLCTEEGGRSWQNPAAVAHSSCQPNPDSSKSWHKPIPFLVFILI